ncbi:MAG: SCP2 sterol-binding domain-containing protein [Myxococcota bacterium]|nr:SCP2 sterol-binding domain-containing protein [Myxococcota bacterium]
MNTEPLDFLQSQLPPHFAKGVDALRASSAPDAKDHLDDVLAARAALRIVVAGEGEAWLRVENGAMTSHESKPEGVPVRAAIEFEAAAAREALSLLDESGRMDDPKAPKRFARLFSARAEKVLDGQKLEFHVVLKDVPDHDGDVVIKIGIGTDTPPAKPQFTAAISYDDLEDLRAGELTPQQLIGRLRLTGDASRAMALGMMLMQPPKK